MRNLMVLLLGLGLAILTPLSADAAPVGKITHIEGRVDITRDGKAAIPAARDDKIQIGDIVRTKSRSKAEILFKDGSILRLASSTRVKVTEYIIGKEQSSSVINLFRGKIQSKVSKTLGRLFGFKKRNRFEVHTPTAVVGVRGTDFFTFYQRGISGSIFKEGTGYGYSINRPDDIKEINAGQAMLVTNPDQPPMLRPATDKEIEQHEGETAPPEKEDEESDPGDDPDAVNTEEEGNQTEDEGVIEEENGEDEGSTTDQDNEDPDEMDDDGAVDEDNHGDEAMHDGSEGDESPEGDNPESPTDEIAEGEPNDMGPEEDGLGDPNQSEEGMEEPQLAEDAPGEPNPDGEDTGQDSRQFSDSENHEPGDESPGGSGPMDPESGGSGPIGQDPDNPAAMMAGEDGSGTFIDGQGEPEPLPHDPTDEDPLLVASQQDDPDTYNPEAGDPGMIGPEPGDPFPMEPYPMDSYPMDPYPIESYPMEPYPLEPYPMDPYPMDPYPIDPIPIDPIVPYIPPELPEEPPPPPVEVLFDGAILRMVAGTASQGVYYNPDATTWPYDDTSDHSGPYDGERYEYFYLSDTNGNYIYGRNEVWDNTSDSGIEHEYLQDGRIITFYENEENYFSEILVTGTWEGDLSYLGQSPSADHQILFAENAPFNVLSQSGWFRGGISNNLNGLWINAQTPFLMKGEYAGSGSPSIYGMRIHQTTDDGAYTGFIGGFVGDMTGDDVEGLTYSIYIDPDNEAGVLKGNFAGSKNPVDGTWGASGEFSRTVITSDAGSINAASLEDSLDLGMMDSERTFGTFGGNGWIKSKGGHGTTIGIQGQDWGVFKIFHGGSNVYENPAGGTSWAAGFLGWGKFGSFQDGSGTWKSDFGIWQAGINNGSWSNGKLSGEFGPNSRFLTLTKIGNLNGEILGTYGGTGTSGTWQAVSMGSWDKTEDLSFSTYLGSGNQQLKAVKSGYYYYSDGSEYSYHYNTDGRDGSSYYYDATNGTETRTQYRRRGLNDNLYAGEWVHDDTTHALQSYSSSGPLTGFDMTSLGDAPDPYYYEYNEWDDYRMDKGDYFEGILGGLADPWTATTASPAEIVLLGERELSNNGTVNQPSIFSDSMQSYNPYNDTFTTPDGGSFWGYFGGRFQNDVKGKIYDLYIAPDNSAGILKGGFTGLPSAGGGAWSAQGGMYPIQMDAGLAVNPQNLCLNVEESDFYLNGSYDYGFQPPGSGYFYDSAGTIKGDVILYSGDAYFASIQNQSWGVWEHCVGGTYSGTYEAKWSLNFIADNYADGYLENQLIASYAITGPWNASNNRIDGTVLGGWANLDDLTPLTGISAGEIVGTFNPTDSTWQAALVGAWIETDQFLALAMTSSGRAKLEALNIPAIEIGRANLYGSGSSMSVTMNDVIFFSNASGGDPKIWATNGIDGYYYATPYINESVTLSGNGLSVDFQVKKWDGGNWGAKVSGSGTYSGTGTMNGETIEMNGAAAGTYNGAGTFSGTAAGVAKKQ